MYSISTDQEMYGGSHETLEDALAELAAGPDGTYWVGECVSPPCLSTYFSHDLLTDQADCSGEYSGDWAEDWDRSTREQQGELDVMVRDVIAWWVRRHDLAPTFWNIKNPQAYMVESGKVERSDPMLAQPRPNTARKDMSDTPTDMAKVTQMLDAGWRVEIWKNDGGTYTATGSHDSGQAVARAMSRLRQQATNAWPDESEAFIGDLMIGHTCGENSLITDDFTPEQAVTRLAYKVHGEII